MSSLSLGIRNKLLSRHAFLGRREYALVLKRLQDGEYIKDSVYGSYQGGSGLLVVTNKRVMIVDRRPFFDYIEDAVHESLNHLVYVSEFIGGSLHIKLNGTYFKFRSFNEGKMKATHELLQACSQSRELAHQPRLPAVEIEYFEHENKKVIKPLTRRPKRHPAWSPHNPIMMGVMNDSGVSLSKD